MSVHPAMAECTTHHVGRPPALPPPAAPAATDLSTHYSKMDYGLVARDP